jgi:hypothetical protein
MRILSIRKSVSLYFFIITVDWSINRCYNRYIHGTDLKSGVNDTGSKVVEQRLPSLRNISCTLKHKSHSRSWRPSWTATRPLQESRTICDPVVIEDRFTYWIKISTCTASLWQPRSRAETWLLFKMAASKREIKGLFRQIDDVHNDVMTLVNFRIVLFQ